MLHIIYYRILSMLKEKGDVFWVLVFPLLLGTCFYAAFGSIYEQETVFESIPVAAVVEENSPLRMVLDELDENPMVEGAEPILALQYTDKEEAEKLLKDEKVEGIIFEDTELSLMVAENGMEATFLQTVLNEYMQTMDIIERAKVLSPAEITKIVENAMRDAAFIENKSISDAELNPYNEFFYALIAMACLYASFLGLTCSKQMKADLSALGMRKCLSPTNHMKIILGDLIGCYVIQCFSNVVLICYMKYVLGIDFGEKIALVFPVAFAGSLIGLAFGTFVGSIPKLKEGYKLGITLGLSMFACFLSGLMSGEMRWVVEEKAPIVNRINPAAVICDAFYALNIYDTLERYVMNIITLGIMSIILCVGSYLLVRRESYDQL